MDKLNEIVIAMLTSITAMGAFIVKKLYSRVDRMEDRIDDMDDKLLTRDDVKQITDTQNLILKHLLEHRTTEGAE